MGTLAMWNLDFWFDGKPDDVFVNSIFGDEWIIKDDDNNFGTTVEVTEVVADTAAADDDDDDDGVVAWEDQAAPKSRDCCNKTRLRSSSNSFSNRRKTGSKPGPLFPANKPSCKTDRVANKDEGNVTSSKRG